MMPGDLVNCCKMGVQADGKHYLHSHVAAVWFGPEAFDL
jgi:hypothetical protein